MSTESRLTSFLGESVAPQGTLGSLPAPLVVVLSQIQDGRQPRGDALAGRKWPRTIDDVQDDVGISAGLSSITPLQLRRAPTRHE